jgi:hypothetical protein
MKENMKEYRIIAGEGEVGHVAGYASTLRGAKRVAARARREDPVAIWARIEARTGLQPPNAWQRLERWML